MDRKMTLFDITNYLMISLFSLLAIYPFWYAITVSLATTREYLTNKFLLIPGEITFIAYRWIFSTDNGIINGFFMSTVRVAGGVGLGIFLSILTAYPLSIKRLRGRSGIFLYIVITMLFSGGLIPYYLLLKGMNMLDTIWVLIIPGCLSAFNVIILKNYFNSIPDSLEESAKIDGANDFIVLFKIIVPLSLPIVSIVCLFVGVGLWNDFFSPMIFISSAKLLPLATVLRSMLIDNNLDFAGKTIMKNEAFMTQASIKMAAVVISIVPVICVYPFVQKYFVKGIMIGSVKG